LEGFGGRVALTRKDFHLDPAQLEYAESFRRITEAARELRKRPLGDLPRAAGV
jgi:hypothetical protein